MSSKSNNKNKTNADLVLNSDIYDLTAFVDDVKKRNIDNVDSETLLAGIYGYLGYEFTSILQNSIVVASELANEAIPTRAKFDRNVITHALSLGVNKVSATPASMKVLLLFPEKYMKMNMIDNKFILKSTVPIMFGQYEFHTDYDIEIKYVKLTDSTNGSNLDYVYTARYIINWSHPNPISNIDNEYLPPISIYKDDTSNENLICIITTLHQVEYNEIEEKVVENDLLINKILNFSFRNQLAHFSIVVTEANGEQKELVPIYDGLYTREMQDLQYCYYQYINTNNIRIRFDPSKYQPSANASIYIKVWTTQGYGGNFEYKEDLLVRLTSDEYTNLYMIVKQRSTEGSVDGFDRKSVSELQEIIPKEALSRGSITTLSDLRNYFNSINNENSVLHVFRKEDNPLTRVYYVYCLMKDMNLNVVPTNTIPVYISEKMRDTDHKIYIQSGTPLYYYKYDKGANLALLKNNYIGYTEENSQFGETRYSWDDEEYNFYKYNENKTNFNFVIGSDIMFNKDNNGNWDTGHILSITDQMITSPIEDEDGKHNTYKTLMVTVKIDDSNPKNNTKILIVPRSYDLNQTVKDIPPFDTGKYTLLESLYIVETYTFNNSDSNYTFDNLFLSIGDHIKFQLYQSDNWITAEVLEVNKKNNRIESLNLLILNSNKAEFVYKEYDLPKSISAETGLLKNTDIVRLYKLTKFIYTSPLSVILTDNEEINSHRVEASYYLDTINEERLLEFTHINSNSPIQFITSNINVNRPSYLSDDRYIYTIAMEMIPNIGTITPTLINRTRVIGVYYKNETPIYSIGKFVGTEYDSSMRYEFKLYTKPMESHVIDDNHCIYFGTDQLEETGESLAEKYNLFEQGTNNILDPVYLDFNTKFRIYILYKYSDGDTSEYFDDLTNKYMFSNMTSDNTIPLCSIVPGETEFSKKVVEENNSEGSSVYKPYTLNQMVLTNIYEVNNGINLMYDYTNIMNSYVTMIHNNSISINDPETTVMENSYIVNRVPCVRYFYLNTEERFNSFIKEMKKKILYVLDALDPLECTFGLDFKFFNTYGPSNMYYITNTDGMVDSLIDNVALSINFRVKLYNESSDQETIVPLIKDDIKTYLENLESLDDIHFPNLTTEIETKYSEHIIYFEFVGFNIYDANNQHIITNENMEMLTVVPEFLCVDTNDYTGLPNINIQVVG